MSFFNKIFGGGKKQQKPVVEQKPKQVDIQTKRIQVESAVHQLDMKIKNFQDQQKKLDNKVNVLKAKAKELIEADKKKDARKYVQQATRVQKQAQSYTLRKKALVDKKFQLEQTVMDREAIDAMQSANTHMKDQQKYSEKLEDLILDGQEAKMQQQQINDKLKDLVGDQEDEDVDDMLNELMGQIKKQKQQKNKIQPKKNVNVQVSNKNVQKQKQRDQIQDMLNAL